MEPIDRYRVVVDREYLERMTRLRVCAHWYYELGDVMSELADQALLDIVARGLACADCQRGDDSP